MFSPDDAKAAAIELAAERHPIFGSDRLDVDAAKTEERELGFILHVQSGRFLETHDASAEIKDVQPIFVHRRTCAATWVKRYGPSDFVVDGQPGPDWPPLATIVVPLAVAVQAASWLAMWWGLYGLALAVGFIPLHFIAFLLAIAISVLPTDRVIRYARFRNFNRWVGLAVTLVGLVLAEFLAATFGLMPRIDLQLERLGVSIELPMELVKVFAALGVGTAGTFIGQHSKWTRTAWDASRVISAPADGDED